jgi:hypothetical protein
MAYGRLRDEAGSVWLMARGMGEEKRAAEGIRFRSVHVL